jgi:hypothetical protein
MTCTVVVYCIKSLRNQIYRRYPINIGVCPLCTATTTRWHEDAYRQQNKTKQYGMVGHTSMPKRMHAQQRDESSWR